MNHVQPGLEQQKGEQHLIFLRRPSAVSDGGETADVGEPSMDSLQSLAVVLQVFDLCNHGTDDMICKEDLESELIPFLGRGEDVNSALHLLNEAMYSDSDTSRFDFLSYWYGMEHLFRGLGCCPHPVVPSPGTEDVVQGMQRLRDGVSEACKRSSTHDVSASHLHDLVAKIQTESREPQQWDKRFLRDLSCGEAEAPSRLDISRVVYQRLRVHLAQAQTATIRENGILAPPLEPEPRWRPRSPTNSHRTSDCPDACALMSEDLQRAHELVEVLRRVIKNENVAAHTAMDQIWALCELLVGRVQCQEADLLRCKRSSQESAAKRQKLEQELRHVQEALEIEDREQLDLNEEMQEQRRRIHVLERELRQVKEECESSHCEQMKLKLVEDDREHWRSRYVQLQRATENAEARSHDEDFQFQEQADRLACLETQLAKIGPLQDENSMLRSRLAKLEEQLSKEQQQHQDSLKELSAARQHAQEAVFQAAIASQQKMLHVDEQDPLELASTAYTKSVASSSFLTTSTNWGEDWFTTSSSALKRSPKKKMRVQLARPVKNLEISIPIPESQDIL